MTQYDHAVRGKITEDMHTVATGENLQPDAIRKGIAAGEIVIPKNRIRTIKPVALGSGLTTKVNANIGSSDVNCNLESELAKCRAAIDAGANAVMDLSTGGDLDLFRRELLQQSEVMLGTVPLYAVMAALVQSGQPLNKMRGKDVLKEIRKQAEQGVDFMTIHAGITQRSLSYLNEDKRLAGVVSRGGSFLCKWMNRTGLENPFYEHFNEILEICHEWDVTISLGDGFRPGAGADAGDRAQIAELLEMGALVQRCRGKGVQVMVEGPGHVPLHMVEHQIQQMKQLCHNAPVYVLGPITTDVAPGYDHITSAIGGALAAAKGADFLCYVTPAEHLCLPNMQDVLDGVYAARIAAHSGDIAKGIPGSRNWDNEISRERKALNWQKIHDLSMNPELSQKRYAAAMVGQEGFGTCSMCGALCSMKDDPV